MHLTHARDPKHERLKQFRLFAHTDKKALRHLAAAADELRVPEGTTLLPEGATFHNVYIVMDGEAVVEKGGAAVSVVLPGEVIGAVALFCHCPTSGTIKAKTDLEVLVIPVTRFWQTMHDNADLATAMAKQMAEQLLEVDPVHEGHTLSADGAPRVRATATHER